MRALTPTISPLLFFCAVSMAATPFAAAQCKAVAEKYEIVDLGKFEQSQSSLRAVSIDKRGRKIVRFGAQGLTDTSLELLVNQRGKASKLKQSDDGAVRETLKFLDNSSRLVTYRRSDPGFRPVEMRTLIDRRGGEIAVKDYCQSPSEGWQQTAFTISRSGEKAAAVFVKDRSFALAQCNEDMTSDILFQRDHEIMLMGISDKGVIGGTWNLSNATTFWRWTGKLDQMAAPVGYSNIEASGMDETGNIIATTTGEITSAPLRYSEQSVTPLRVLPGKGWDVTWQVQAPCGEIFGQAIHTNIEDFLDLPQNEQDAMRDDMRAFLEFAAQREDAYFLWSPEIGGRFMSSIVDGFRDWQDVRIADVNTKGVAVGHALNAQNEMRAIAIQPIK